MAAATADCDSATGVISWSIPELDPGQTDTITYEVNPPASADMTNGESFTNTATSPHGMASADVRPGTRTYGPASASVALPAEFPNLVATKSAPDGNPLAAFANQPFTWEVSGPEQHHGRHRQLAGGHRHPAGETGRTTPARTTFTPPAGPATTRTRP